MHHCGAAAVFVTDNWLKRYICEDAGASDIVVWVAGSSMSCRKSRVATKEPAWNLLIEGA